jgi:hypothetical protein
MVLVAASISLAFRSFIFAWAISATWLRLIVPANALPGSLEPDFRLAAFFSRKVAGGVFVVKEKLRSA